MFNKNIGKKGFSFIGIIYYIFLLTLVGLTIWFGLFFQDDEIEIYDKVADYLSLSPSSGSNGVVNITVFDDTDNNQIDKYTFCDEYCAQKNKPSASLWTVDFFANYTTVEGVVIDDVSGGNCEVQYTVEGTTGSLLPMTFDLGNELWSSTEIFNDKGIQSFEVFCTSGFGNINLDNDLVITNTIPYIIKTASGFIDFDGDGIRNTLQCIEDIVCLFDFSTNVSEDDFNDVLTYGSILGVNTTLGNFSLDAVSGLMEINVTTDDDSGDRIAELSVVDTESPFQAGILEVNILPVNDPPHFVNLSNQSFNRSVLFEYVFFVEDEEMNSPFEFNISFESCETAEWSTRDNTDCVLFNETEHYNFTMNGNVGVVNISFVPSRNDVGNYTLNFTSSDSGSPIATGSKLFNFTVLNVNEDPYFSYVCDNERNTIEDEDFSCDVNATDIDETENLTFLADKTWFTFFDSGVLVNPISIPTGIETDFNVSVLANFSPSDSVVGNWVINVTVFDTGNPRRSNSSIFDFFVDNVDDLVDIQDLADLDVYTSNNYSIFINATDDDLLIPDKSVFNEILSFSSNTSWVGISLFETISGSNISVANITFNPNDAGSSGIHKINLSVNDASGFLDTTILQLNVLGNFGPSWENPETTHILLEDVEFYLNLTENVSDGDMDSLFFEYELLNELSFDGFETVFDVSTGELNLTPGDIDVGEHLVVINVSDGVTASSLLFNFTVQNVNDLPYINSNFVLNNATIDDENHINVTEDVLTSISFFVNDDDLLIPFEQSDFYQEFLFLDLQINGSNSKLLAFERDPLFPGPGFENAAFYTSLFIPNKSDIGDYNISLNISDFAGDSDELGFNLTVLEVQHSPILDNLTEQATAVNMSIYYDINATDAEDGDDSLGNLIYSYEFLPDSTGIDFINGDENIFNTTSGVLNASFADGDAGFYHYNLTVTDSSGLQDFGDFYLYVYDLPNIILPLQGAVFELTEGLSENLTFVANSSSGGSLDYFVFINSSLRSNLTGLGNGMSVDVEVTPDFVDETHGEFGNLTLVVSIPGFEFLNSSRTWDANISHVNAPVLFLKNIGDKQAGFGQSIDIDLKEHFSDPDYFDQHYNQTVIFDVESNAGDSSQISVSVSLDWVLSLSASATVSEVLNVTGADFDDLGIELTRNFSNNFVVEFTDPIIIETPVPTPSSGGGSGGAGQAPRPVLLKLLLPDPTSIDTGERIVVPIHLVNDGGIILSGINLTSFIAINGGLRDDLESYFDVGFIDKLNPGENETVTLTIETGEGGVGTYEITIEANVQSPPYFDTGKIFITVRSNQDLSDKILFTEELIASNPECIEIKEIVEEARAEFDAGNFDLAQEKIDSAIESCRESISQQGIFSRGNLNSKFQDRIFLYLIIATVLAIVLGIVYYIYRNVVLKRSARQMVIGAEVNKSAFNQNGGNF